MGGGNEKSNLALTRAILEIMGMGEDRIQRVADRPGHDFRYSLDCSRIHALGWRPLVAFEEGLRETVRWYRENEAWWRPLKSGEFRSYYRERYGDI